MLVELRSLACDLLCRNIVRSSEKIRQTVVSEKRDKELAWDILALMNSFKQQDMLSWGPKFKYFYILK